MVTVTWIDTQTWQTRLLGERLHTVLTFNHTIQEERTMEAPRSVWA